MASKRQRKKNEKKAGLPSNQTSGIELNEYKINTNEYNALHDGTCYSYSKMYHSMDLFNSYSKEQLESVIKYPMENNKLLRDLSKMLYSSNGIYTNTVDYMEALPSLQYVIHSSGNSANIKSKYKDMFDSALDYIDHKKFIRDALHRGMVEGIAFYYCECESLPETRQKFLTDWEVGTLTFELNEYKFNTSIIPLPTDYTKIHHIVNGHYAIAFDLRYFLQCGVNVDQKLREFPKEIRDAYEVWINRKGSDTNGNWVLLDHNKTIVHKVRSDMREPWGRPLCLAAIPDIMYSNYFTDTKRNILNNINNEVWIQTFPESDVKGQTTLTKAQQKAQHETVSQSLRNKDNQNDRTVISIMAGTKIDHVEATNTDILDDKYESNLDDKIAMYLGIAGSLLSGTGSGSYSTQTNNLNLLSAQLFEWIEQISKELNKVLNYSLVNNNGYKVEVYYLPITFTNRKDVVSNYKELYTLGKGPITLWAAACGIPAKVFLNLIEEENEIIDWNNPDKFPIHQTAYTLSSDDKESGRPTTDNPSDETVKSQAYNTNGTPKPNT